MARCIRKRHRFMVLCVLEIGPNKKSKDFTMTHNILHDKNPSNNFETKQMSE